MAWLVERAPAREVMAAKWCQPFGEFFWVVTPLDVAVDAEQTDGVLYGQVGWSVAGVRDLVADAPDTDAQRLLPDRGPRPSAHRAAYDEQRGLPQRVGRPT